MSSSNKKMAIENLCTERDEKEQEIALLLTNMAAECNQMEERSTQFRENGHHSGGNANNPTMDQDCGGGGGGDNNGSYLYNKISPFVKTLNEYYEKGKESSYVLKYSAETVESGLSYILSRDSQANGECQYPQQNGMDDQSYPHPQQAQSQPQQMHHHQPQPQQQGTVASNPNPSIIQRWNTYLSSESIRSIQYCIEWLKYANSHIQSQVDLFKTSMDEYYVNNQNYQALVQLIIKVKREVVETMRKVVEVVGKYAYGIQFESRNLLRGFILSLPMRLQLVMSKFSPATNAAYNSQDASRPGTRDSSKLLEDECNKVLYMAQEGNSMLKSMLDVLEGSNRISEYFGNDPNTINGNHNNASVQYKHADVNGSEPVQMEE